MNVETNKAEAEVLAAAEDRGASLLVMIILFAVMFFAGLIYVDLHAGGFSPLVYAPYRDLKEVANAHPLPSGGPDLKMGERVYVAICQACHQPNGRGLPGQFPPLAGSEWVYEKNPARLIRIVQSGLTGPISVMGQEWNLTMPNMGASLSDDELAAMLSYIRVQWGNKAPEVTAEKVKKVRQEILNHPNPWTQDELKAVPVE